MTSLLLLIPISIFLLGVAGMMLWWAVESKQFEDLERHALDVIESDKPETKTSAPTSAEEDR